MGKKEALDEERVRTLSVIAGSFFRNHFFCKKEALDEERVRTCWKRKSKRSQKKSKKEALANQGKVYRPSGKKKALDEERVRTKGLVCASKVPPFVRRRPSTRRGLELKLGVIRLGSEKV